MWIWLLLCAQLWGSSVGPVPRPRLAEADSLLRERQYIQLERWLARPGVGRLPGVGFFQGIIDNRRNRNSRSVARLAPLLDDPAVRADTARRHALLETLADDYGKLFRYADASRVLELLEREFGATLAPHEREGLAGEARLRRLLAGAPPQRTRVAAPFSVALRRDGIGLLEAPARVGADSSWWIVDTGANFSTITEGMARQLGLTVSADSAATFGVSGALVSLHVAVVPLVRLGAAEIRDMVVLVLPDSALYLAPIKYQIRAILGYPVLEALRVVTLAPDRLRVGAVPTGAAEADLFLEQLSPLVGATVAGRTELYHLDTGANSSDLTWHFRAAYPELFRGLSPDTATLTGAGGSSRFPAYALPDVTIALGSHRVTLHGVRAFAESTPAPFDHFFGNLGQDVLGGAALTLDFDRMKVLLSRPGPAGAARRQRGAAGRSASRPSGQRTSD